MDGRNIYVTQFKVPKINSIISSTMKNGQILIGDELLITGTSLKGKNTFVEINGIQAAPMYITDSQIRVSLNYAALRPGTFMLQVVHKISMGKPPSLRNGPRSNSMSVKIRPAIVSINQDVTWTEIDHKQIKTVKLIVVARSLIGKDQDVNVILNKFQSSDNKAYTLPVPNRDEDTNTLEVQISGIELGTYLARLEVDKAESMLSMTDGVYSGPLAEITEEQ